jgi:hypothetical protein
MHSDIDTNRHDIELNNNEIRDLSKLVTKNQAELTAVSNELISLRYFFEIVQLTDAVENQVDYLVEVKIDSQRGFCNDRAVDRDFLIENLQSLEANKVGLSPIFNSWEWRDYYKHEMCSAAMENDLVWITLRIPLVKKAEKLVRVIPLPSLREALVKVESYGLEVTLFRERNNDKFHVMTRSSLEFCTDLGKVKSCSVRDARFSLVNNVVIPVEFALNRFLLVSSEPQTLKLMGRCPNGVNEHTLTTDKVLLVPVNCSYIGKVLTIDTRESDTQITREIGIVHFNELSIEPVKNFHLNISYRSYIAISNRTSHLNFETNKKLIDDQLKAIDTKHDSLWERYMIEKWLLISILLSIGLVVGIVKVIKCTSGKRSNKPLNDIPMVIFLKDKRPELSHEQQQQQQKPQPQLQQQQEQRTDNKTLTSATTGVSSSAEHVYTEVTEGKVSFGLPPESSQFYQKCPKK